MPALEDARLAAKYNHLEEQITAKLLIITGYQEKDCCSAVFVAKRVCALAVGEPVRTSQLLGCVDSQKSSRQNTPVFSGR
jgi:hypothetical protein